MPKSGNHVNYQSIGSGGGIAQIQAATVDFGASDKPLAGPELDKLGLGQFPVVIGGIVPVFNVPGVAPGAMKLDGPVLANIFLGKITKWNDAAIAALNPGLPRPDVKITIVHRSDGSGTSFNFTNYLSKVSPEWKSKVGKALRCSGRPASAARETRAWRRTSSRSAAASAMSNTPMRCITSSITPA